ncbi:unnamed protein product [Closterium sp. NIES-65]|nr:unnamed protein product [Closterium sp. NIES-65]
MSATHVIASGIAPSYGYFKFTPDKISVTPLLVGLPDILTLKEAIEPQLEMAGLIGFARGAVATPSESYPNLQAEFRVVHLLTFRVISRCCFLGMQIALKPCRDYLDAGHQAWHFIESTYQVTDDLYIGQLEEQMTHMRMGDQETAMDYCNRAQQLLATMRMSVVQYSTSSYVTHVLKGFLSSYNLMKRLSVVVITRATLNEDSLTSYILRDEAMQEADRSLELLPQTNYSTPEKEADSSAGGKGRDYKEASCSLVGIVEPTVSLAPKAGEDFQAMAEVVQANLAVVLLDSGCSHHLMGANEVYVDMQPSGDIRHVHGFNGALHDIKGWGTVALQGEAWKHVLISDMLYAPPGVHANLFSAGQLKENGVKLKENGVKLKEDGDGMLLVTVAENVLGQASYSGRVLCTDLRPCSTKSTTTSTEVVALQAIVSATKSTSDRLHERLAHAAMDTIRSSAKHEVATGLDLKSASGADSPCVSCVSGKLAGHTFPDQGSDADDVLAVVHIDLCGPFSTKKSLLMLRSDRGGEFLGKDFTAFVDGKGIVHDLICPYTPQQNVMAEREMRTVVELVRTMLLHMGVQNHWWHLALWQAAWVRNCLERSTLPPRTTPYQVVTEHKLDLSLERVWGYMAQFLVPQHGGKLKAKARWGLHLSVSEKSNCWELLDIADNRVVTTSDVVFYKTMLLEVWKSAQGPASGRMQVNPPTDALSARRADVLEPTSTSASGDGGCSGASPVAPAKCIAGGRSDAMQLGVGTEQSTEELQVKEVQPTLVKLAKKASAAADRGAGSRKSDHGGVGVRAVGRGADCRGEVGRDANCVYDEFDDDLQYDDAEEDEELPELDPDMNADPEHRWDISTMTVKEELASWKGKAVKAAMEEDIRSLIGLGTWELVERPPGVNIMKNRWVLTTKYHINDTVKQEKVRLVMKGSTQVYGADYDETYAPMSSYVILRIFLSFVAILDLNLMQLDMKNAFLQSKLDRVLYMNQPDYFNDGTGRVCKLLKSPYELKQSPLLWYRALDGVLLGAGWKKSQVDTALYFMIGNDGVACWMLVYVNDLLAANSSTKMLKELKELLEAAFELREISLVQKYLGLEIVRDRPATKLWLHQQG